MKKVIITFAFAIIYILSAGNFSAQSVSTSDIDNFWQAFDKIKAEENYEKQIEIINRFYIDKGTPGLKAIMQARNYTDKSYVDAINKYPEFWKSIRRNTYKAKSFAAEIEKGTAKLKRIYPDLKPAEVYFTIGVFRTSGTTLDKMVLIGSELALADENVDTSEFPESFAGLIPYIKSNPIEKIVFLNVHEYVHTQQKTADGSELLNQSLREGVAEFITVKALKEESSIPAFDYGKQNRLKIKERFAAEMFSPFYSNWLWNNFDNEFKMRDLGYFVGYDIAKSFYEKSPDKKDAIKEMIELNYQNPLEVARFVDNTEYFSKSIGKYRKTYEKNRPKVKRILQFNNRSRNVNSALKTITIEFSEKMDKRFRGFELGPLGKENVLSVKKFLNFSEDGKYINFEVELEPDKRYQVLLSESFRNTAGLPLKPFLIDIKTKEE